MAKGSVAAESARAGGGPRWLPGIVHAFVLVILAAVGIEALLAFRVWVQLSGEHLTQPALRLFYDASSTLVAPFQGLETTAPIRPDGVLELATIVAIEAYLVLAVLVVGAALFLRMLARFGLSLVPARNRRALVVRRERQPA